jgi:hypothetical protein
MSNSKSPLTHSIGLSGIVRWLIAVWAVIAIGDAFHEGHYGLAIAGTIFVAVAAMLGFKAWRARQVSGSERSPNDIL